MKPNEILDKLLKYVEESTDAKVNIERLVKSKDGRFITYNGQSFYISIKIDALNKVFVIDLYFNKKEKLLKSLNADILYSNEKGIGITNETLQNIANEIKEVFDDYIANGGDERKNYSGEPKTKINRIEALPGLDLDGVKSRTIGPKFSGSLNIDIQKSRTEEKKEEKVPVLFGTNRKLYPPPDEKGLVTDTASFTENVLIHNKDKKDYNPHLGVCIVNIPRCHKPGNIERLSRFLRRFIKENPEKHFTILGTKIINKLTFREELKKEINHSNKKDALLFIHGFNVKFEDAMFRTAQLGFDLDFQGAITAFSWPSQGNKAGYIADIEAAIASSDYLCNYIKIILEDENIKRLHIIAHSMGNVVLTEALKKLKREGLYPNPILRQIILAAPDIDKDIFIHQIMPAIKRKTPNIILYASDEDKALDISKGIRIGRKRLGGEGGENIAIGKGLDSIDASEVSTDFFGLGHGYFAEKEPLIDEIRDVLLDKSPEKRGLKLCQKKNGDEYWKFVPKKT